MHKILLYITVLVLLSFGCNSTKKTASVVEDTDKKGYELKFKDFSEQQAFDDQFFNGLKYKANEDFTEAVKSFEKCLKINNNAAVVHFLIAQCFEELGNYELQKYHALRSIDIDKDNEAYLVYVGSLYIQMRNNEKAAVYFNRLVKLYPEKKEYAMQLATCYTFAGKLEEAIKTYDHLEKRQGLSEETARLKEQLWIRLGKPEKAIHEIEELSNAFPENTHYMGLLAELSIAYNKADNAFTIYKKILALEPGNGKAHFGLATIYRDRNDSVNFFNELKLAFKDENVRPRDKVNTLSSIVPLADKDKNYKQVIRDLALTLAEVHPDEPAGMLLYADILYDDKDYIGARKYYHRSLLINDADPHVYSRMLWIDEKLKDFNDMYTLSTQALDLFPNHFDFYYFNAKANLSNGSFEKAVKSAKGGLALEVEDKKMNASLYAIMGEAYTAQKKYTEAGTSFEQALESDPANSQVKYQWATLLLHQGSDMEKAERLSARAVEEVPENGQFLDTYGSILFRRAKYTEAAEYLKKALALLPENTNIMEHYGDVLYKLGKTEDAVEYWKKAKYKGATSELLSRKIIMKQYIENE